MSKRQPAPPYSASELEVLKHDALDQPTPTRRRAACALLALGLGAGLDGRWLARVGPEDVTCDNGVVEVAVGEPAPRRVVVVAEWENEVLDLAETAGDGCLIGTRSNARNRVQILPSPSCDPLAIPVSVPAGFARPGCSVISRPERAVTELCQAAGLQSLVVLSDLMVFVEPLDDAASRTQLRRGQH